MHAAAFCPHAAHSRHALHRFTHQFCQQYRGQAADHRRIKNPRAAQSECLIYAGRPYHNGIDRIRQQYAAHAADKSAAPRPAKHIACQTAHNAAQIHRINQDFFRLIRHNAAQKVKNAACHHNAHDGTHTLIIFSAHQQIHAHAKRDHRAAHIDPHQPKVNIRQNPADEHQRNDHKRRTIAQMHFIQHALSHAQQQKNRRS